jgi:hypothetical protein
VASGKEVVDCAAARPRLFGFDACRLEFRRGESPVEEFLRGVPRIK